MFRAIGEFLVMMIVITLVRSALTTVMRVWALWQQGGHVERRTAPGERRTTERRAKDAPQQPESDAEPGPRQATALHQDPVCGTYVAADTSLKKVVNRRVVHFCSDECRNKYKG